MTVLLKQSNFTLEDLLKVAQKAGIKTSYAKLIILHIQTIFHENFAKMAKELEVNEERIKMILGHIRRFDVG